MRTSLSQEDIKELRYQCRMGYIIPFFIFVLGSIFTVGFYEFNINSGHGANHTADSIIVSGFLIISFLVGYSMNHKYYSDISNNVKVSETKTIQWKEFKTDFEAGSGNMTTLPHNNPMKEFIRYDFVIDNIKYRVEKELFESCSKGDQVLFYYAPISRYLISIEKPTISEKINL